MLLDLSLKKHRFCPTDTLTRRREGYHLKLDQAATGAQAETTASIHDRVLAKEAGLKNYLVDDWYLKRCFIDHFFTDDVDFDKFRGGRYGEEGDFIKERFIPRRDESAAAVTMTRDGHLWRPLYVVPVRVVKRFAFDAEREQIRVRYELSSTAVEPVRVTFAVENNFSFQAGHAEDRSILIDAKRNLNCYLDSLGQYGEVSEWAMVDQYRSLAVALRSEQPCDVWHMPIFTVSLSEAGFEKVYQGTTFVNLYHLHLGAQPVTIDLVLYAGDLKLYHEGKHALSAAGQP